MIGTRGRSAAGSVTAALVAVAGCAGYAADLGDCRYEKTEAVNLDVDDATVLVLNAGAGSLSVEGRSELGSVAVRGSGCVSDEDRLDDLRLVTERRGGEILVRVEYPELRGSPDGSMDLVVRAPSNLRLRGTDGSGDTRITGLGDVDFTDGSGALTVLDAGRVTISDGSGPLRVERVASLDLDDGSGSVRVGPVEGAASVRDGSGSLEVRDVGGDLHVRDGSGSIRIERVGGALRIDDGSGSVDVSRVAGSVEVEDGSGSLRLRRVDGDVVLLSAGSGSIDLEEVAGRVRGLDR